MFTTLHNLRPVGRQFRGWKSLASRSWCSNAVESGVPYQVYKVFPLFFCTIMHKYVRVPGVRY